MNAAVRAAAALVTAAVVTAVVLLGAVPPATSAPVAAKPDAGAVATGTGDRLTARADDFVVRWGRAFNRRDWAWIRQTSGPAVRRNLGELRSLRRATRLPLTRNCERLDGMPAHERLCSYGLVMEVSPVRTATGVLRMSGFAIYR
jgi:hypothetical protein